MKQKYLLAVDRFDQSLSVVRYFSKIVPPDRAEAVLFRVNPPVPECLFDLEKDPHPGIDLLPIDGWSSHEKEAAEAFFDAARIMLLQKGFAPSAITVLHQPRQRGIARDIADESRKGYAALLIGRSETHDMNDISLGSVTTKLVHLCDHLPLAVIGANPPTDRFLIGMDRSEGARRAVEFVAGILHNPGIDVTLCHVIRSLKLKQLRNRPAGKQAAVFSPEHELKWQKINQEGIRPVLHLAERQFVDAGWAPHKVHSKVILEVEKRSQCLVNEMLTEGHGSIVLGRRGASVVKEFFMGRVGQKVLNLAANRAVWIVN
ncbi:MAG: universal stress protein [Thermodesulfobacteriota bacterium]